MLMYYVSYKRRISLVYQDLAYFYTTKHHRFDVSTYIYKVINKNQTDLYIYIYIYIFRHTAKHKVYTIVFSNTNKQNKILKVINSL